jgi:hypothetical protein
MNKLPEMMPDEELEEIKKLISGGADTMSGATGPDAGFAPGVESPPDESFNITYEDILADETLESVEERTRRMVECSEKFKVPRPEKKPKKEPKGPAVKPDKAKKNTAKTPAVKHEEPKAAAAEYKPQDAEVETAEFSFSPEFHALFSPSTDHHPGEEDHFQGEPPPPKRSFTEWVQILRKEDETQRLTPEEAQPRAYSYSLNLRLRTLLAFTLTLPLIIISVGQTWGILPAFLSYSGGGRPYIALFFMALLQMLVMLCGIDVLARGLSDLLRLRPGGETLAALACFSTLLHIGSIALRSESEGSFLYDTVGFLPYSALAALSLTFALWSASKRYAAYAKTYKMASSETEERDCVISEENIWEGAPGFSRRTAVPEDFTARTEAPDLVSRVMRFFTPFLIVLSLVLTVLASSGHEDGQFFFWIFSAFCCVSVPLTTFTSYPMVYSRVTDRICHMGAALAGWSGAVEASQRAVVVIEDGDIFPPGALTLNGLKIFGDHSFETIISLSASILHASGSGLFKALETVSRENAGYIRAVTGLEMFEGGVSGVVGNDRVAMGTLNFMHSMGVLIPPELSSKSSVFTSVNHDLAGILAVSYTPVSGVKGALLLLEQQEMNSLPAVRDINIAPTLLKEKFGINPDSLEWPTVEERVRLSDPARPFHGKVTAVLAQDGLCPYAEAVIGGQRLHKFTKINLFIHFAALLMGLLVAFYFTSQTDPVSAAAISPANLLLFMGVWWAAQWVISWFSNRY